MAIRSFHVESDDDFFEGLLALAHVIRYFARAEDEKTERPLTGQERLLAAAKMVKKTQREGSFADQLIDFVASPTQEDGKPKLSIVRTP